MSMLEQGVAIRRSMAELCEMRNQAMWRVEQAHRVLGEAESIMRQVGTYGLPRDAKTYGSIDDARRRIDAQCWQAAFRRTGLTAIMDEEACTKMLEELDRDPPPFTIDNVQAQMLTMYQTADAMFARGVYNVFRRLDRHYRTNDREPFRLGPKAVIRGVVDTWARPRLSVCYRRSALLNDIDRVLRVLDGKTFVAHSFESALNAAWKHGNTFEDDYVKVRAFGNGNAHIWFKREDLLERINDTIAAYCGGNALVDA